MGNQAETHKLNELCRVDAHPFIQCEVVVGMNAQYHGKGLHMRWDVALHTIMSS